MQDNKECVISYNNIEEIKLNSRSGFTLLQQAENIAINKTNLTFIRTLFLSILAGMMIGMGATFMLFVKADSTLTFAPSQILGGLCFSLGLVCVIIAGAELFTGNALMVCAAADKKISWKALLKNWSIVYVGNLIGSLILVFILMKAGTPFLNDGAVGDAMINVAVSKIGLSSGQIFFRGIVCNWLVCLAVWMGFAGHTVIDKVFTTIFPVMAFVACGFEHCVANMFFLPMGTIVFSEIGYSGDINPLIATNFIDILTLGGICHNIIFATLGNIVGGAIFVGMFYWIAYSKNNK